MRLIQSVRKICTQTRLPHIFSLRYAISLVPAAQCLIAENRAWSEMPHVPLRQYGECTSNRRISLTMAASGPGDISDNAEERPDHNKDEVIDGKSSESDTVIVSVKDSKQEESTKAPQLSKRAQKRLLMKERLKEQKKAKRAIAGRNTNPGFSSDIFAETDYYFENGLRKVYPYPYTFATYTKERWFGRTIHDVFTNEFRVDSPDNFRTSVAKGNMRVNGNVVDLDYRLENGDLIEHHIHRHENPVSDTTIEIIEDTPDLVVINKPASIPCHPCGKFRFNSIVFIMGKEFGYANLRNIYRLDRLTSGVLIMGKTTRKTKELENQVLHRHVHKEYVARVVGEFPEEEIEVNQPLASLSQKLSLVHVQAGGKPSRTTFQRISSNGKTSVVKCIPHTGRTHQIRVHLQYLGYPIVNDPHYNSPSWGPLRGKGGHCDVSLEELCQRILKEHNVGMWCEGENTLFKEKLSASNQASASPNNSASSESSKAKRTESPEADSPPSSPVPKRPKLSTDQESLNVGDTEKTSVDPGSSSPLPSVSAETGAPACTENVHTEPCVGSNLTSSPTTAATAADANNDEGTAGGSQVMPASKEDENKKEKVPNGFDPQRWIPDPTCESCRLKYVDPKPYDLRLYLHACRYKGPTWEYSTKLPDWAAEDWEEPPEYDKYLS